MRALSYGFAALLVVGFACSSGGNTSSGTGGAGGGATTSSSASGTSGATSSSTSSSSSTSTGGMICKPGEVSCDGSSAVQTCKADGSGYDVMQCATGTQCATGKCVCIVGQTYCNGDTVQACGMDGMLHDKVKCPTGSTCRDGLCDDQRCPDELGGAVGVSLPTTGWPRYRHDNRSSGWTHAVVADNPKLKWKVFVGGAVSLGENGLASGPVVNQSNQIFITAGDGDGKGGHFYSFDATGKQVYEFPGPAGYAWSTPAVRQDGTAYYSTGDGHAYAVKPNGMQDWAFAFGFQNDCAPIVTHDGLIIYGSDAGSLFALDPQMGSLVWQSDPSAGPGEVDSGLAMSCDGLIYAGGRNGFVQLDAKTGATIWKIPTSGPLTTVLSSPNVDVNGTMYGLDNGGMGYAIDKTGKVLWSKSLGSGVAGTDFARVGDRLFAVLGDGSLHAFDIASGNELWSKPVGNFNEQYKHGGPVVDGNMHLYFSSNDGNLYAFDTMGNQLWKLPTSGVPENGNSYGSLAIGKDGTIYVPANDGNLYAFQ